MGSSCSPAALRRSLRRTPPCGRRRPHAPPRPPARSSTTARPTARFRSRCRGRRRWRRFGSGSQDQPCNDTVVGFTPSPLPPLPPPRAVKIPLERLVGIAPQVAVGAAENDSLIWVRSSCRHRAAMDVAAGCLQLEDAAAYAAAWALRSDALRHDSSRQLPDGRTVAHHVSERDVDGARADLPDGGGRREARSARGESGWATGCSSPRMTRSRRSRSRTAGRLRSSTRRRAGAAGTSTQAAGTRSGSSSAARTRHIGT